MTGGSNFTWLSRFGVAHMLLFSFDESGRQFRSIMIFKNMEF
jgi:hypothetical protein